MTIAERMQIAEATEACRTLSVQLAAIITRLDGIEARMTALEDTATSPPGAKYKAR